MGTNRRKRAAAAKQRARRHLLRRLREAGRHGLSTDLNPAYELIYAVGVEKQGNQSRLQMIPGEARVMEQQPFGDLLGRVGGTSGFHTTPTASNKVGSMQRSSPAPVSAAVVGYLLMGTNCVTSSTGLQEQEAFASSQAWLTFQDRESSSGTPSSHRLEACWWVKVLVRLLVGIHAATRDWPMKPFPRRNPSFLQAYLQQDQAGSGLNRRGYQLWPTRRESFCRPEGILALAYGCNRAALRGRASCQLPLWTWPNYRPRSSA